MKAKWVATATLLLFALNHSATAAPKAAKPIPPAFQGYWVGGHIKGKPLSKEQIASQCAFLLFDYNRTMPDEERENGPKGIDFGALYNQNIKFEVTTAQISSNSIDVSIHDHQVMEPMTWLEHPKKYSKYTPNHIAGISTTVDYEGGSTSYEKSKFNYYIRDNKLYLDKDNPKPLTRCSN